MTKESQRPYQQIVSELITIEGTNASLDAVAQKRELHAEAAKAIEDGRFSLPLQPGSTVTPEIVTAPRDIYADNLNDYRLAVRSLVQRDPTDRSLEARTSRRAALKTATFTGSLLVATRASALDSPIA